MKFKYTFKELLVLKKAADELRELEGRVSTPLTQDLLDCLVKRLKDAPNWTGGKEFDPNVLFNEYVGNFCGCMGPRDGEPFCNCEMSALRYIYRYDVALAIEHGYEELKVEV